jgi:hypothetical protein
MKSIGTGIAVALALLAAGYLFIANPVVAPLAPSQSAGQTYANDTYGVSFSYPEGYVLSEEMGGEGLYVVRLIREEDAVPVVAGGEGPTAITLEIAPVEDDLTLEGWLTSPASNFQISNGTYSSHEVEGLSAVHYSWSGLYEGETTALLHEGHVVALSVTYMSPADPIRAAYDEVLSTLRLR